MKSSEANADARTEYTEDNPHPSFRPSVSALSYKLRSMKQVQNDEALLWVLDQQIFWRWVSQPNPDMVFRLLGKLYFYWGSALSRRESFGQSIEDLKLEYLHFEPRQEEHSENQSFENGAVSALDTLPEAVGNLFNAVRPQINTILVEHQYEPYMRKGINVPHCTCGRDFEFLEDWTKHVRIRIKQEVVNAASPEGR